MAEPIQKPGEENIVIRTMKEDLAKLSGVQPKKEIKPTPAPVFAPIAPIVKETEYKAPTAPPTLITPPTLIAPPAPITPSMPRPIAMPPVISKPIQPIPPAQTGKLPVLNIPPKAIPPESPYKTKPTWMKLGGIALVVIVLVISGLYGYWKIFVQGKLPAVVPPVATTTEPILPAPIATTTLPIKFFNKLPNKSITIDLPSKTSTVLMQALKSEAKISETRSSIKQIKITYQGKPLNTVEFLSLMSIPTPKDFLLNYEDEFAFAYFSQKEGARPILILKAKDQKLTQTQMTDWEKTTLASNVLPLFLSDSKLPITLQAFKSYLFINQPVRYLNVKIPFTSLNYTIYNDFLIFSTSSAGMFVVLQDLTGQIVSQNDFDNLNASIETFVK